MFMIFLLFPMLVFACFWNRPWKSFWVVLGTTFAALGFLKVTKLSSAIDANIDINKWVPRTSDHPEDTEMGARREVHVPPQG